jgi:hypothetical protein
MNFQPKILFSCTPRRWLKSRTSTDYRSKPVRNPKPFTVFQPIPGQNFPKPLFVIHAYSLAQARALVAAKVAGETIVVGPVSLDGASQ